jgi:hypothetical protein
MPLSFFVTYILCISPQLTITSILSSQPSNHTRWICRSNNRNQNKEKKHKTVLLYNYPSGLKDVISQYFSKCGPCTSISMTLKFIRNTNSCALPQTHYTSSSGSEGSAICVKLIRWSCGMLKFENQCSKVQDKLITSSWKVNFIPRLGIKKVIEILPL